VDRIIEVAFSDNADLDASVAAPEAVIAAYATRDGRPGLPFWPMLFANLTIRLLGSDDFPSMAKRQAADDLTTAARQGAIAIPIGDPLPLGRIAEAHDRVDVGPLRRVLVSIPG
jgi:NADPH:quinone reductase